MRRVLGLAVALAVVVPSATEAQQRRYSNGNSFSFAPYVGAFKDAYDFEADGSDLGWTIGFRAGYMESRRLNLNVNFGYAQSNDVATRAPLAPIIATSG